jgi:magnesium chelatase subunit D
VVAASEAGTGDAWLAARLFAIDPACAGGIVVQAAAGPVRDRWLADLRALLGPAMPWRAVPLHVDDDRLIGGIDLAATLRRGMPVAQPGLLAEAHGGVLLLAMAERVGGSTAAQVAAAIDRGESLCLRHGIESTAPARFGVVALDEGVESEERTGAALRDRLAFHVDLRAIGWRALRPAFDASDRAAIEAAATRLAQVGIDDATVEALCAAALALGVGSVRASVLAVRVARLSAALGGRCAVAAEDAEVAARLVLGPRATQLPASTPAEPEAAESQPDEAPAADDAGTPPPDGSEPGTDDRSDCAEGDPPAASPEPGADAQVDDLVLAAAAASIPPGLLARLGEQGTARSHGPQGRQGVSQASATRGRPAGMRREKPRGGARLDIVATLRAAAPWQALRGRERPGSATTVGPGVARSRIRIRAEDFHVGRFRQRGRTTTIFAVDASGSSALQRLAEAKGAVELLLADCYVRRDSVAVVGFRGRAAELLLPPTRSLVRAKRSLAELPGGGGTPLAAGIDAALQIALSLRRRGDTPVVVILSDGRANVARDGSAGRERAEAEAAVAAKALRDAGVAALFIDTSPRPHASVRALAAAMGARYVPLPYAEAASLSAIVRGIGTASAA